MRVWILRPDPNKDLSLQSDLEYFQDRFVGRPMQVFQAPEIRVLGKTKRLRDFVSWMLTAPVISEKAKIALNSLIHPYAQIFPLIDLRGKQYYTINVTALSDCLDVLRSEVLWSVDDPTRIRHIKRHFFTEEKIPIYPIFKLTLHPTLVFVTRPFVDCVIENGLRGAAFADPSKNSLDAIMEGRSLNVVEGVPE